MKISTRMILIAAASLAAAPSVVLAADASHGAQGASAALKIRSGKVLYNTDGHRIARIYDVTRDGNPQVILQSAMWTVPASTLSMKNGKITTSLTRKEIVGED